MEGWRAHCALQMVQGLRWGRSGEGPEMDGLIMIGSLDTDPCSWVPSSTLDPQWRATLTANGEMSCDLSFSHVSFCLKKNNKTFCCWCLTVWFSLLLIGSSEGLNYRPGLLCCSCFLTANTQISHPWNVPGEAALLSTFHQTQVEQRQQIANPKITPPENRKRFLFVAWVSSSC